MNNLNPKIWSYLEQSLTNGKLNHAYLFCGLENVGKFDLALDFACLVNDLAQQKEQVREGLHPDVLVIRPLVEEKKNKRTVKNISIEQLKPVLEKIGFYAYQARYKFLIIDQAQRMTNSAANSLLKLIEEPKLDTIIILTTTSEEAVLPTIRSRCQRLYFGLKDEKELEALLKKNYTEKKEEIISRAARLAHGKIKLAESYLLETEKLDQAEKMVEEFRQVLKADYSLAFELAERISKDKEQALRNMEEWIWYLGDFLRKLVQTDSDWRVEKRVLMMLKELLKTKVLLESTNVNDRLQLESFFVKVK